MQDPEGKKNHRSITLQVDVYNKLVEMGSMNLTFNDLIADLIQKANATQDK
jgi:predicted CopG family antitoxin